MAVAARLLKEWEDRLAKEGLGVIDGGDVGAAYVKGDVGRKIDNEGAMVPKVRAEFWRRAEIAAAALPYGWPRGPFIRRAVRIGNVNRAAREAGITQKAGEWAWRKFLVFAGLPAPLVKGSQGRKRPNRDGLIRVEAGRYREAA